MRSRVYFSSCAKRLHVNANRMSTRPRDAVLKMHVMPIWMVCQLHNHNILDFPQKKSCLIRRANWEALWITFAFYSPILIFMFPGPESSKRVVVQCRGCGENIPAPVETMPSQPIAARCPLCHEHRRYLPSEVFLGRLSHLMIRKPVSTADGRVGR
jgi:hypothetical protein